MPIRKMKYDDIPQAEYICIKTADNKLVCSETKQQTTLLLYSRYYTRAEIGSCFVIADEQDLAVGYILCAEDYRQYKKSFLKKELRQLIKINPSAIFEGIACVMGNRAFAKKYPAHMHIDILPEYQDKGFGTMLVNTLIRHLKNKNVKGLMLIVDSNNQNAVRFYKKNGFKEIRQLAGAKVMGMEL